MAGIAAEGLAVFGVHPERQHGRRGFKPRQGNIAALGRHQDAVRVADFKHKGAVLDVLAPDVEVENRKREAHPVFFEFACEADRHALAARLSIEVGRTGAHVADFGVLIEPASHFVTK